MTAQFATTTTFARPFVPCLLDREGWWVGWLVVGWLVLCFFFRGVCSFVLTRRFTHSPTHLLLTHSLSQYSHSQLITHTNARKGVPQSAPFCMTKIPIPMALTSQSHLTLLILVESKESEDRKRKKEKKKEKNFPCLSRTLKILASAMPRR